MTDIPEIIADSGGSPDGVPHFESEHCWCKPEVMMACPECEDRRKDAIVRDSDEQIACWRCNGRALVEHSDPDAGKLVIHRYEDED